ncbi:hypothetical protein DAI22_03g338100 [Oryza sativa Japonica Group]|nr:hypothetical protein DAI22_03g338100 [Oryza sativa Japonica Group]
MVPLHLCWSDTRNEIQGEMVLPNMQESLMRGSPKLCEAGQWLHCSCVSSALGAVSEDA